MIKMIEIVLPFMFKRKKKWHLKCNKSFQILKFFPNKKPVI